MTAILEATPVIRPAITPLPKGESCVLTIFGASGDLTRRKLIPALFNLACRGCIHPQFDVLGVGRTPMTSEEFRVRLHDAAAASGEARDYSEEQWAEFEKRIFYFAGDPNDAEFYPQLHARLEEMRNSGSSCNHLFYVSTPASVAQPVIEGLGAAGLNHNPNGWSRIVLEKPFGHDLDTARELNAAVLRVFAERDIYRIDHYLGKETVQNILVFRFASGLWCRGNPGDTHLPAPPVIAKPSAVTTYKREFNPPAPFLWLCEERAWGTHYPQLLKEPISRK